MNYRYIGQSQTDLDGGTPIGPGEYTGPIDIDTAEVVDPETGDAILDHDGNPVINSTPKNKMLLDEGLLVQYEDEKEVRHREREEEAERKAAEDKKGKDK